MMSAFEARKISVHNSFRNSVELTVVEPTKLLVRMVVNKYREAYHGANTEIEESLQLMNDRKGLPTQPAGYLKFPTYDWF